MTQSVLRTSGTVVIPAFNEGAIIADSLTRVDAVLSSQMADRCWDVIVVDDGSTDDTAQAATAAAATLARPGLHVRVLRHVANGGLGAAIRTGFAASSGDVVVVLDCDLSYDPGHIPALVAALESGSAQVAIASPYMSGGRTLGVPRYVELRSRSANRFLAAASNQPLATYTGMVRAYEGRFIRALPIKSTDQRINIEIVYKTQVLNGRIVEVPATLDWRGLSSGRAARSGTRNRRARSATYRVLLDGILFRPYVVFFGVGATSALVGMGLVILSVLVAPRLPWASALGAALIAAGLLTGACALLSIQIKRSFDELYFLQSARVVPVLLTAPEDGRDEPAAPARCAGLGR